MERELWPPLYHALRLPVGAFLRALEQLLRDRRQRGLLAFLEGKALPVRGVSTDKDAGFGRGAGCKA